MTPPSREEDDVSTATLEWAPLDWEGIVQEHSARVYRLAYRLTGNRQDAEDLTQDVFIRVFRSLDTYEPGNFSGWLHRITTNLFLDRVRRKSRIRMDGFGVLGIKLGTVRSRIHRGRTQLREALAHRAPRTGRTRFVGPLGVG